MTMTVKLDAPLERSQRCQAHARPQCNTPYRRRQRPAADRWHRPVMNWLQANPEALLVTTGPVLTEVCALLARRVGNADLPFDLADASFHS